jgi:hypothetical protein
MLRIVFEKEKIETEDFFFPKACLTPILQNFSYNIRNLSSAARRQITEDLKLACQPLLDVVLYEYELSWRASRIWGGYLSPLGECLFHLAHCGAPL